MAILSTLLSVPQPHGMWESIIRAFEGFTNNYILAIILLTVIIRLIWAPIDTYNKRIAQKNSAMQLRMKPELDKLKERYGSNQQLLNQKQNEIYKKYNYSAMGSCGFMAVFMILNMVIFFTLFAGLNNMAAYKISENYDHLKYTYVNCASTANNYILENGSDAFKDTENLFFKIADNKVQLLKKDAEGNDTVLATTDYKTDFSIESEVPEEKKTNNEVINSYLKSLDEVILIEEIKDEEGKITQAKVTALDNVTLIAMPIVEVEYRNTKENFLWMENIWVADSPFKNSIFDYETFKTQVRNQVQDGEETIYNSFMPVLKQNAGRVNGYFILPILCVLASWLSMWLMQRKNKAAGQQVPGNGKIMQFLMPVIMGVFALFYTAVFAIYMFISQLIAALLTPLQNLIVDKWSAMSDKKKQQKQQSNVDYRR